jgi:hypothetical protein
MQHRNHNHHADSLIVTGSKEQVSQISPMNSSRKKDLESPQQLPTTVQLHQLVLEEPIPNASVLSKKDSKEGISTQY